MKRYLTSILLWFSLLLSELHTFWENASQKPVNWILKRSVPMSVQWNVKMLTDQIWYILIFVAMFYYKKNRINRTTVITFIFFSLFDTVMYVYNYKTYEYSIVYFLLLITWILIYVYHGKRSRTKERQGIIIETEW